MDINSHPDNAYAFGSKRFNVRKMILPRTNKQGQTKVYVEVCKYEYEGEGKYSTTFKRQSTDVWIIPKNWNKNKEEVTRSEDDHDFKNNKIDKVFTAIKNYINSKGQQEPDQAYYEGVSIENLREFFPARKENRKCLTDYVKEYIKFRKNQNTVRNTAKTFTTTLSRLEKFDEHRKRKTYLEDLTFQWSDEFELFLRQFAQNKKEKGYKEGTIDKTYANLITALNYLDSRKEELGIDIPNKYMKRGWRRGKRSANAANPLTKDQLETLFKHKFEQEHLEKTRIRFCIQCYTGLRYSDLHRIKPNNIHEGKRIVITPQKTQRHQIDSDIPLNDYSRELLDDLDFDTSTLYIENQPYNRNLKELFTILQEEYPKLKYKNDYGTHNGRDTFISNAVMAGVDFKTILIWVGQKSYSIMDRYIKVTDDHQQKQMGKVYKKPKQNKRRVKI